MRLLTTHRRSFYKCRRVILDLTLRKQILIEVLDAGELSAPRHRAVAAHVRQIVQKLVDVGPRGRADHFRRQISDPDCIRVVGFFYQPPFHLQEPEEYAQVNIECIDCFFAPVSDYKHIIQKLPEQGRAIVSFHCTLLKNVVIWLG